MTTTYCGVTIDPSGQVVDVDGDVIEGLYAIGEVTGGFHGAAYMTGTSLGKGAVFGRIVAAHAAAQLPPPSAPDPGRVRCGPPGRPPPRSSQLAPQARNWSKENER